MNHGGYVRDPSDWLDFSANIRPEGPPQWVREAFEHAAENLRYDTDPEMKHRRILVRTCSDFGLPDSFRRLAVKTEEKNIRLAAALGEIVHER